MAKPLSKTRILSGLQCQKKLYLELHKPSLARKFRPDEEARFAQGHEVGEEARQHYPGGKLIDRPHFDFAGNVAATERALSEGVETLYEASFQYQNFYARVDILHKNGRQWDLIEVKSSTSAKNVHLTDAAVQSWILTKLGLPLGQVRIMHINTQCIAPQLDGLFIEVDVTEDALKLHPLIEDHLKEIEPIVRSNKTPQVDIGPHCDEPYECRFKQHCFQSQLVPSPSVFNLPNMGKRAWEFYHKGKVAFHDLHLPDLSEKQQRVVKVTQSGEPFLDKQGIEKELQSWSYPLHYLDFETLSSAIPRLSGERPYDQIPFQWSLHIEASEGAELEHHEFLNDQDADPREAFCEKLVASLGPQGHIVSYNKGFESARLKRLSEWCPQFERQLLDMERRLVDPMILFQKYVYFSEFQGSYSIKSVAPVLLGQELDYSNLKIRDGNMAQVGYRKMLSFEPGSEDREELRRALLQYCRQDTLAMVELVKWLRDQVI